MATKDSNQTANALTELLTSPTVRRILEFYETNPHAVDTLTGLAQWLGESRETLAQVIAQLEAVGIVQRVGEGSELFTYRPSPELSEAIRQALSMPPTCESTAVVESVAVPGRDEIVSKIHKDVAQVAPEESMLNMSQEAIDALNASTSPSEYLVRVCELCRRYVNVDKCAFLVRTELLGAPESVNGAAGTLIATLQVIGLAEGWIRRPTVTISMDALIEVAQHRKSVMITKGSHEYPYTRMREWLVGDVDAFIVAPVLLNGTAAGLFMALLEEASFGERERCALEVLLRQASVGIRYWQLQLQFERVSSYSHNLLESVNAGVIALDSQGYITTFNVAAERIFGLAAVQALGAHFKDALGGAFNPRLIGIIQRVLESGESIAGVQLEYLKSLGGTAIINLRAAPLRNEQGITIGAVMIVDDVTETMRRREALYRVLPRHVADRIFESPEALVSGGERRIITVLFADMHGFTSISERLTPEDVVDLLNDYLPSLAEVVFRYEGTVDKFLGDGLMAFFGAPERHDDDTWRAVKTAWDIRQVMDELSERRRSTGIRRLTVGIGINTGEAIVGYIGSEKVRMEFTAVGDTVNVAKRLQEIAIGDQILLSESTYEQVRDMVIVRELGPVTVAGRREPVYAFLLEGLK